MQTPSAKSAATEDFVSFKNRPAPVPGMKCRVYRNLNSPGFFSVLADEGEFRGKVLGYARCVGLVQVSFKVRESGYRRLQLEQIRNVHGFAIGTFIGCRENPPEGVSCSARRISYHPFKQPFFFDRAEPGNAIHSAPEVWAFGPDLLVPESQEVKEW